MKHSVQVRILGREYTLRSEQSPEQVERVAAFVEERLTEMAAARAVDTRDLTVLTLLNLAGQYLQQLDDKESQGQQLEQRLQQLLDRLPADDSGC